MHNADEEIIDGADMDEMVLFILIFLFNSEQGSINDKMSIA